MSDERVETKCKVECKCGWTEVFSSQFSGVIIECPECGKTHLIPVFDAEDLDDTIDMEAMERLLSEQREDAPVPQLKVTVPFKPLFNLALGVSVVIAIVMAVLYFTVLGNHPVAVVAVVGGGFSWPLAIAVAWLGQRRQLRKVVAEKNRAN